MNVSENIAIQLLKCKSVKLSPEKPFTWASGWKSPIYCDNRKTLAYPALRSLIKEHLAAIILEHFADCEVIAGVATGAIAQGALVADALEKPFCYIRSTPKGHGLENLIEGELHPGQKVVIVEDLISTGKSSLKAAQAVKDAGAEVIGMVAIFTYQFPIAIRNFEEQNIPLITLSNYSTLLEVAIENNYVKADQIEILGQWRLAPDTWGK